MTRTVEAIYEGGVLKPVTPIDLEGKTRVLLHIEAADTNTRPLAEEAFHFSRTDSRDLVARLESLSPENRTLYERIQHLRSSMSPVDFDIVEALNELREHG